MNISITLQQTSDSFQMTPGCSQAKGHSTLLADMTMPHHADLTDAALWGDVID